MTTLHHIKKDLPDWPDDVVDQWLLIFANQPEMGWPPPDPIEGHRWGLLLTHPLKWWKDVSWKLEDRDCSFDNLSIDGRKTMNGMFLAVVAGEKNNFSGDNSPARFQRQLAILARTGKFKRRRSSFRLQAGLVHWTGTIGFSLFRPRSTRRRRNSSSAR